MCRYFEEEDEEDNMAYQPAPGSPGEEKNEESEEEDPLDAFMADIEVKPENIIFFFNCTIIQLSSGSGCQLNISLLFLALKWDS